MQNFKSQNAVDQRLKKIGQLWQQFAKKEKAKICLWHIDDDESQLMNSFFQTETSEVGNLNDFFLEFESEFKNSTQYTNDLITELESQLDDVREELDKEKIEVSWTPQKTKAIFQNPENFTNNLQYFIQSIPSISDGLIVAYLRPPKISDLNKFLHWIGKAIESGIPKRVRICLLQTESNPLYNDLIEVFPVDLTVLCPELDIDSMMSQLAAMGDPKNPGVQYRKKFIAITQAGKKQNLGLVDKLSKQALDLTKKNKWPHLEVFTHSLVATIQMNAKKMDMALKNFGKARSVAQNGTAPVLKKLLPTTIFSQAAVHIINKNFKESAALYEEAVGPSQLADDLFGEMEAWRMAAMSYEAEQDLTKAWLCNQNAVKVGEKMRDSILDEIKKEDSNPDDIEIRKGMLRNSMLPYIGDALLRLAESMNLPKSKLVTRQKMIELVGIDWEERVEFKSILK